MVTSGSKNPRWRRPKCKLEASKRQSTNQWMTSQMLCPLFIHSVVESQYSRLYIAHYIYISFELVLVFLSLNIWWLYFLLLYLIGTVTGMLSWPGQGAKIVAYIMTALTFYFSNNLCLKTIWDIFTNCKMSAHILNIIKLFHCMMSWHLVDFGRSFWILQSTFEWQPVL